MVRCVRASVCRASVCVAGGLAILMSFGAIAQTTPSSGAAALDPDRLEVLARSLSDGVSCTSGNPRDLMDERGRKSGATPADVGAALSIISSSDDICAPVRLAASAMSADMVSQEAASQAGQPADSADAALSIVAAAQTDEAIAALEAEARAASTRFNVGPPPRNLTRGRIAGL